MHTCTWLLEWNTKCFYSNRVICLFFSTDDSDDVVFKVISSSSYSDYSKSYRPPEKFRNEAVIVEHAGTSIIFL